VQGELKGAEYTADIVTKDGQFITGRGPAAAMEFGYAIAEHFLGEDAVAPLREGMIYNQLFKQMLVDVYKGF
jgi:4-methyl-5(b-hydroxyethyl)-thiazole monophosphate biosynthesis